MNIKFRGGLLGLKRLHGFLEVTAAQVHNGNYAKWFPQDVSIANLRKHIECLKDKNRIEKDATPNKAKEVLVYITATCPSLTKPSKKLVTITPLNKNKKVRFAEPATSLRNTQKQVDSYKTQDSNQPVLPSTGMKNSTSASRSQPSGNTKKNRISLSHLNFDSNTALAKQGLVRRIPDLSYLHVFGALCYPTNDSEDIRKLQPKADIGIFVGPEPQLLTPRIISSELVPNPPFITPYVPPIKKDWDIFFQLIFDKYFNPQSSVVSLVLVAAAPRPADPTGIPSLTIIDQDAPSPSTSQTPQEIQTPVTPSGVEEHFHDMKLHT
ncbi:hypothetical protein Tco_0751894 [Tanacetum coccineum]|uniref:Integrase, catalytic region, zinc finger, CCHC-type, peptidase aspartic, catalytic n=1 Tax=Tanacetum coccineum TaxID=301880 RepID=A0ABQ4Z8V6_9ASTR